VTIMLRKEFVQLLFEYFASSQATIFDLTKKSRTGKLTAIQYNILEYLYFNDGKGVGKVADCMSLSLPNASREVKKLTELFLLKKLQDMEDKRKTYIYLTDKGKAVVQTYFKLITSHLENQLKDLTDTDQIELEKNMRNLMEKLFN